MSSYRRTVVNISTAQMQEDIQHGAFDKGVRIPTFQEFDGAVRRRWAKAHGVDMLDSYKVATDEALRGDYGTYIAGRFLLGAFIGPRLWKMLDGASKQEILRAQAQLRSSA